MKKILIVEDDSGIAELERDYLEANSFAVEIAADGSQGLQKALAEDYALILLDIMLPGQDGFPHARNADLAEVGVQDVRAVPFALHPVGDDLIRCPLSLSHILTDGHPRILVKVRPLRDVAALPVAVRQLAHELHVLRLVLGDGLQQGVIVELADARFFPFGIGESNHLIDDRLFG